MATTNGSSNGRTRLDDGKVRVVIIGVGNCANSLLQGREYYKDAPDDQFVPGLMHVNLGGYHVRDIEFTAAFDVVIDPALAALLNLKPQGTVGLVATAAYSQATLGVLDSLEAGSLLVLKPLVVIQDLGPIQAADSRIRGVLGESFLAHFDVLIDYSHGLLCLDDAKLMERYIRGERIPLVTLKHPGTDLPFSERLVVSVNLSDTGNRPILLQVDSGSDGPILYAGNKKLEQPLLKRAKLQGPEVSDARRAFALLPPQDMRVGSRIVRKVPFVTPASGSQNVPDREEDGILATVLFQRVYVSHSNRFVVFDPR